MTDADIIKYFRGETNKEVFLIDPEDTPISTIRRELFDKK